ncbi:hypothetical protein ACH5RR_005002 [Cinchona calisaya]|uniref:Uncharacterized protein n=1 Tax=Cinchona calisaya TaxID=153742 RepID=A0ABD3AZL2_9GENT
MSVKENRLFQILEPQLQATAELGRRCPFLDGVDRPTIKEVVVELEGLRKFTVRYPWPHHQHDEEESSGLMTENEGSDLYKVGMSHYSDATPHSGQRSLDTTQMMITANSPR